MKIEEDRLCRLCLRTDSNEVFQEIGDTIKEMLEVLKLKLDFFVSEEGFVCTICMESIQKCFDFKSTCRNSECFILPFYNSENKSKMDLREVYMQKYMKEATDDIPMEEEICRFCMKLNKSSTCKPLIEIEEDMLHKCIPELNLNLTKEPVICDSCLNSLKFYFQFLQTCMDTEEKIIKYCKFEATGSEGQINLSQVLQFTRNMLECERDIIEVNVSDLDGLCCETKENDIIKTEIIVKKENAEPDREYVETDIKADIEKNIVKVEIKEETLKLQDGELETIHEQYSSQTKQSDLESFPDGPGSSQSTMKDTNIYNPKHEAIDQAEVTVENPFTTKHEAYLKTHILAHQELSEVTVYACEICSLVTKKKSNLDLHIKRMHRSEITVYSCARCSFKTKYKHGLKNHMLKHQELSEGTVYKCESCSFITRQKSCLKSHMLVHQELSEVTVYVCESCSYVTKYKSSLKMHNMRMHRSSEVTVYNCAQCSFKTRYKHSLRKHVLIHQELKCTNCSFVTKEKSHLKSHMLVHQEPSEVKLYKCTSCPFVTKIKRNLNSHNIVMHPSSEMTEYNCDQCSFKTKHKYGARRHMSTHRALSEMTSYNCDQCSFKSRYKQSLDRHMLSIKNHNKNWVTYNKHQWTRN